VANFEPATLGASSFDGIGEPHEWDQEQVKGIEQAVREKPSLAFDLLISPTENALPEDARKIELPPDNGSVGSVLTLRCWNLRNWLQGAGVHS
jgi:hypothetical protein